MKIVLSGIETNNKGAELMLYAILQEIEKRFPMAKVFVPINSIKQGLGYIKTNLSLSFYPNMNFINLSKKMRIPSVLRHLRLPCGPFDDSYPIKNADYFIDASGYLFTDYWQLSNYSILFLEEQLRGYWKQGTKIIYLPQAFGPIEKSVTKKLIHVLDTYANILMPRDKISKNFLLKETINKSKIYMYPDFTTNVKGYIPDRYKHLINGICIIPNSRMIDRGGISKSLYIKMISYIADYTEKLGYKTFLLNHEGDADEKLAFECGLSLNNKIDVVSGLNGLEVKGLISSSYLCISSRFHGVASALSSCIPCLATSWSHKYEELFNEYDMSDSLLDLTETNECINKVLSYIDKNNNDMIRKSLENNIGRIQQKNIEMWNLVWNKK